MAEIDLEVIKKAQLDTNLEKIAQAITAHSKLKVSASEISIIKPNKIRISLQGKGIYGGIAKKLDAHYFFRAQDLKAQLPEVVVAGTTSATRAVISETNGVVISVITWVFLLRRVSKASEQTL